MTTLDKLNDIALKLQMGKATPSEVDTVLIQLLSSSYNEGKYRHDEVMRMLNEIHILIQKQSERIEVVEKDIKIMKPVVYTITTFATPAALWGLYRILAYLFP